jgi:hypothetical protein
VLHVDIPSRDDLRDLLTSRAEASVSIYVATTPVSIEIEPSRIELKNLATRAGEQLHAARIDKRAVTAIEEALDDLVDDVAFWQLQANSLAIFMTPHGSRTFRLPNRLTSGVEVSDRFHVKPLLRAATFPHAAFLLAIAEGSARLLEMSPDLPAFRVKVEDMPTDAAGAAGKASLGDRSPSGRIQGSEGQKVRLAQYARQIDAAIRPVLTGTSLPLILAATDPLDSIFRAVNTYARLAEAGVPGNPEAISDADLAAAARPILDGIHASDLAALRARFDELRSQGRAATDIVDVARAATYGAVDAVFLDIERTVPGTVDEDSGQVTFGEPSSVDSYGVLDEIARRTFLSGGRVLAVRAEDVPDGGAVAALLRYPI